MSQNGDVMGNLPTKNSGFMEIYLQNQPFSNAFYVSRQGSNLLHHRQIPLVDALTGFKAWEMVNSWDFGDLMG